MPIPIIKRAWLESTRSGIVELDQDWNGGNLQGLTLDTGRVEFTSLGPAPSLAVGSRWGYVLRRPDKLMFVLPLEHGCEVDPKRDRVYVAGDFNGWQQAVGRPEWELGPDQLDGKPVLLWTGTPERILWPDRQRFKFVTGENLWLGLPDDAPNSIRDGSGNANRFLWTTSGPAGTCGASGWTAELDLAEPQDGGGSIRVRPAESPDAGRVFLRTGHRPAARRAGERQ
jgi:pullulanase